MYTCPEQQVVKHTHIVQNSCVKCFHDLLMGVNQIRKGCLSIKRHCLRHGRVLKATLQTNFLWGVTDAVWERNQLPVWPPLPWTQTEGHKAGHISGTPAGRHTGPLGCPTHGKASNLWCLRAKTHVFHLKPCYYCNSSRTRREQLCSVGKRSIFCVGVPSLI